MWWKLDKLEEQMKKHSQESNERLHSIEKVLVAQEENLKQHMKRSDHLEEIVINLKENDIKSLRKHVSMVEGGLKLLGILGLLISILGGVARLFGLI